MRALSRANNTTMTWLVVVLLLCAAWYGARWLSDDLLWGDEWGSIWVSGGAHYGPLSPAEIIDHAIIDQGHPPLYAFLLAIWGTLAGWSEVAGRGLSWLCGLLTIAWTYRFGCDAVSRLAGVVAAVALTANIFFAAYMHELRMYTLFALVTVICLWLYWRNVSGSESHRTLIAFTVSVSAALYTHYLSMPMLAILGLYHVLSYWWLARERRRLWWKILASFIVGGLTFLPWALGPFMLNSSPDVMAWRDFGDFTAIELLTIVPHLFANRAWPFLLFIGAFGLLEFVQPARRRFVGFLLFWTGGTLLLVALLNFVRPFVLSYRYLLMLWPAAALLVGISVNRMSQLGRSGGVLAALVMVAWVGLAYLREGPLNGVMWRGFQVTLDTLQEQVTPQDAVVFYWGDAGDFNESVLACYTASHHIDVPTAFIDFQLGRDRTNTPLDESSYRQRAENFIGSAPFVWLVIRPYLEPAPYLGWLETVLADGDYTLCGTVVDHPDMRLLLYRHENAVDERGFDCAT